MKRRARAKHHSLTSFSPVTAFSFLGDAPIGRSGAASPHATYTPADIAAVVAAARARGVRVIPEIDVPGHTASWGKAFPGVLTPCLDPTTGSPLGTTGPLNPAVNETWAVLWSVLSATASLFPDAAVHLGGDESALGCWGASPAVRAWGAANGAPTPRAVLARFMEKAAALGKRERMEWNSVFSSLMRGVCV